MKLNEKQAFKILNYILNWADPTETITPQERVEFVMTELINLEIEGVLK